MTGYSARIIIEGGTDLTVELNDDERARILLTAYGARTRNIGEQAARSAEQLNESLRRAMGAFANWGRPAAPRRQPTPQRPETPRTVTEALSVLEVFAAPGGGSTIIPPPAELRTVMRRAKRAAHPDTGGTAADFQLVTAAEEILRRAGRL